MEEEKPEAPSSFFADKIFGSNPFPKDDARREQWETNASYAAEEIARMEATVWRTLPAETAPSEQFLAHALNSTSGIFDILARRLLIFTVNGPASLVLYEECLTSIITGLQKNLVPDKGRFGLSKEQFLSELKIRFKQRKAHWTAEAFKLARDSEQPTNAPETSQRDPSSGGAKAATQSEARIQQNERKGYRLEVREWMQRQGLTTLDQASKKLAVGLCTLKSIMSDKGSPRYSTRTLETVLSKIGHRQA